jgi:hypothetical protein
LQASLFVTLARPLGLGGPGGRDAFGDLFEIAVTAAWAKERDGEPIRSPRARLRHVIVNQRKMQLRSQRGHPATSFDELAATAESTGGPSVEAIADRRPSVSEQVERRELAELVTQIPAHHRAARPHHMDDALPRGALARRGDGRPGHHPPPVLAPVRAHHHRELGASSNDRVSSANSRRPVFILRAALDLTRNRLPVRGRTRHDRLKLPQQLALPPGGAPMAALNRRGPPRRPSLVRDQSVEKLRTP